MYTVLTVTKENYVDVIDRLIDIMVNSGRQMMAVAKFDAGEGYQFTPYFPQVSVHHCIDKTFLTKMPLIAIADKYSDNCLPLSEGSKVVYNDKAITFFTECMEDKWYRTIIYNRYSSQERDRYINGKLYERITDPFWWWDYDDSPADTMLRDAGHEFCHQLSTMLETHRKHSDFSIYLGRCLPGIRGEIVVHLNVDLFVQGAPIDSVVQFSWGKHSSSNMMTILSQMVNTSLSILEEDEAADLEAENAVFGLY